MTVELGFQGTSKNNQSLTYFNVTIPTDGSSKKVHNLQASNNNNHVNIPNDFVVTFVQLANVPNNIHVQVHFESENVQLNGNKTKVDLPGQGLALGNATVSAKV